MKKLCKIGICCMMAVISMVLFSCSKKDDIKDIVIDRPDGDDTDDCYTDPNFYAGFFAYNVMNDVYLWKEEISASLKTWKVNEDPIEKVNQLRYKDASGKEVDKWTMLTNDYESFTSSVSGVTTTYGYDFQLYYKDDTKKALVAVITYTYPDSPARNAGLKRGDAIFTVNGKEITVDNYADLLLYSSAADFEILNDKRDGFDKLSMTAVNMYLNPVLVSKIFESDGKKVGYLVYTSFTLESCAELIEVCKNFKKEGVKELILDLRYNGGGYVITENLLASMLAPAEVVKNKEVFETEIWNKDYMDYYAKQGKDLKTRFQTTFKFTDLEGKKHDYSTADANIGLDRIIALVTRNTASASESVLVGLKPYMNIQVVGEQTHGKYCTGWMKEATQWFNEINDNLKKENTSIAKEYPEYAKWETYAKNWGIYVMISRYADRDGYNPCMPDGMLPDVELKENPQQPYELGDDREILLRQALTEAGITDLTPFPESSRTWNDSSYELYKHVSLHPLDGMRIRFDDHTTYLSSRSGLCVSILE